MSSSRPRRPGRFAWAAWCAGPGWLLAAALAGGTPAAAVAQPLSPESAGREALRQGKFPWYDESADGLRRINVEPPGDDFAGRRSNWDRQRKPPAAGTGRRASIFSETMQVLMWVLASLLLAGLIALLVWAFLRNPDKGEFSTEPPARPQAEVRVDRVEELPVPVVPRQGSLLDQARAHHAQGNLRDAIICLFSYMLIQLDNHHAIHLERGKTNRQYLRELRGRPELRGLLEQTMVAFEDVFFGQHSLTPERFASCLGRIDEFHHAVRGTP